jgi:transcriptional regulator with XRE-family HTH domain
MTSALSRFGQHCRNLRMSRTLTMGEQADALACTIPHISAVETGRLAPSEEYLDKFSDWLQLDSGERRILLSRTNSNVIPLPKFITNNSASMRLFRKISKMAPCDIREFSKHREVRDD